MPYDPLSASNFAGENNQDGKEFTLFVSGSNIFTLQFVHYPESPGMYRPIVRFVSKNSDNVTCGYVQVEEPYQAPDMPRLYSREEIVSG